ncbi:PREDICTED: uncharacterized protein LOC109217724 [Nicotiana attenuata]|uniref:uncharacterized protein LOC109217724 n=1 Tax=Nicotiana attenuata TaxID=49451 RepID=UPI000904ADD3|nr:PREDICTED: uncharacterized protein LOC109217724 [Nicotiana attenuata]
MKQCFDQFSAASGLKANLNKSSVYFGGVTDEEQEAILQQLRYIRGELPFKYLGVPLATRKMKVTQWQPLIDKIVARISSWIAKKLSYDGRIQLIRAVCKPKSSGGLNILNLKKWNRAAILKLHWDLTSKADRLWIKWLHMYHIKGQPISNIKGAKQASWMERMLTADRLSKWSMTVDTTCVFYNCQPENHHHLFYYCTIIMEIWNDIFKWMQIQVPANTWSQLICWFVEKAKKKSTEGQLLRMILAETLYSIWVERNHRVFEKIHRDRQSIVREIIYICNIRSVGKLKEVLQYKFI